MSTIWTPEKSRNTYEQARVSDGPWNKVGAQLAEPGILDTHYHARVEGKGPVKEFYDAHSQILCYVLKEDTRGQIRERTQHLGNAIILGPDSTEENLDELQATLQQALKELGWGDYEVTQLSSGTRANEDAVGYLQAALDGPMHLVVLDGCYHGSGFMKQVIGHDSWQGGSTVKIAPPVSFLQATEGQNGLDFEPSLDEFLAESLTQHRKPVFIFEPVQGVGGFRVIDPAVLQRMIKKVHAEGGLVLMDCVQTFPYRTGGNLFCQNGIVDPTDPTTCPDAITTAKGLGNGHPIGITMVQKVIMQRGRARGLGMGYDTFGRNIVAAAQGNIVMERARSKTFQDNLRERGHQLRIGLRDIMKKHPGIVTGLTGPEESLMQGIQLVSAAVLLQVKKIGLDNTEIVFGAGGKNKNIMRLGVRLDQDGADIDELLQKLDDSFKIAEAA